MICTFTPEKARGLTIPATDELLRDWVGPALTADGTVIVMLGRLTSDHLGASFADYQHPVVGGRCGPVAAKRLPLSRPEVRDHLVRVAARGEQVEACHFCGIEVSETWRLDKPCVTESVGHHWSTKQIRPPADLSAFRDGPNLRAEGWTSAELSAALLWISWRRLEAGAGRIAAVYRPWRVLDGQRWRRDALIGRTAELSRHFDDVPPHLRELRDDSALAKGVAVLSEDGTLTAEVPISAPTKS